MINEIFEVTKVIRDFIKNLEYEKEYKKVV